MSDYQSLEQAAEDHARAASLNAAQRDALALLVRWNHAIERQELAELRAMMAQDIVITLPFNESGRTEHGAFRRYEGIDQCCAFWTAAFEAEGVVHGISEIDLTVDAAGTRLFFECRGHLTMQSGRDYRNRYVMRMDVRDGKVAQVREYYNPIQSAYAFGRPVAGQFMLESL